MNPSYPTLPSNTTALQVPAASEDPAKLSVPRDLADYKAEDSEIADNKQPFPLLQKQQPQDQQKTGLKPISSPFRPDQSVLTESALAAKEATRPLTRNHAQSVSFCESDGPDKSRRFTISAYPSANNVTSTSNGPTVSLPPSRKASLRGSGRDSETLSFAVTSKLASHLKQLNTSDAVTSQGPPSGVSSPVLSRKDLQSQFPPQKLAVDRRSVSHEHQVPVVRTDLGHIRRLSADITPTTPQPIKQQKKSNKTVVASPVGPPVPFQQFLSKEDDGKFHILLACTGSVATLKMPLIIDKLFLIFGTAKISIQLILTKSSGHFLKGLKIHNDVKIWRDDDEWANFNYHEAHSASTLAPNLGLQHGAKKHPKNPFEKLILHNELRRWADIMLIAPLSANTLAKILNGIADNLLTSIVRAWGPSTTVTNHSATEGARAYTTVVKKPILVAPAMNTFMYTHPITAKQLAMLSLNEDGFGFEILKPVEKVLVCGDIGMGGMREWSDIVDILRRRIGVIAAERGGQNADGQSEADDDEDDDDEDASDNDDDDDEDDDDEDEDEDDEDEDDDEVENSDVHDAVEIANDNENDKGTDEMIFDITEDEADGEQVADVKKTYNYDYENTED